MAVHCMADANDANGTITTHREYLLSNQMYYQIFFKNFIGKVATVDDIDRLLTGDKIIVDFERWIAFSLPCQRNLRSCVCNGRVKFALPCSLQLEKLVWKINVA